MAIYHVDVVLEVEADDESEALCVAECWDGVVDTYVSAWRVDENGQRID